MAHFLAVTSKGLGLALKTEIENMDLKVVDAKDTTVTFESNWAGCYRANLRSRVATRILLPVLDFPAYQADDIYNNAIKNHDFTKYMKSPDVTFMVDANVKESKIRDQRIVAMKLKDAIVDQCYKKWDRRPDVDKTNPDLVFFIKLVKNQVSVSISTSGTSLSQRGYRKTRTEAPLREHIAAGLLNLAGWNPSIPLVDLMCGSGTFLIEAALQSKNVYPGADHDTFAFQKFPIFEKEVFEKELNAVLEGETDGPEEPMIWGYDISGKSLQATRENAARADVEELIELKRTAVALLDACPSENPGMVVVNPPYGERLEDPETVKDIYRDLAFTLKNHFKGWDAWILSGNPELSSALRLKAEKRLQVFNGNIECRWLKYQIR